MPPNPVLGNGPIEAYWAIVGNWMTVSTLAHDDKGIKWPASVAPYDVHVVVIPGMEEHAQSIADFGSPCTD